MTRARMHIPGIGELYSQGHGGADELMPGMAFSYNNLPDEIWLCDTTEVRGDGVKYWNVRYYRKGNTELHSKNSYSKGSWWSSSVILWVSEIPYDPNGEGETDDDI